MGGHGKLGLVLVLTGAACGCSEDADRLGRICHKVSARFDGVTGSMRGKLQSGADAVGSSVIEPGLESRVALRLRWDRDMAGAEVRVNSLGAGVVELHGTVADLRQRRRAIELAGTTVGVENVIDKLATDAEIEAP